MDTILDGELVLDVDPMSKKVRTKFFSTRSPSIVSRRKHFAI